MNLPPLAPDRLAQVMQDSWPAAESHRLGPWLIRDGAGGGKRVSAVSALGPWQAEDIALAEAAQDRLGQPRLFAIGATDQALDQALAARGYQVIDPVLAYAAPVERLAGPLPPVTAFALWPPLAIQRALWREGDIGPARLAVMARCQGPHCALLGRIHDRAAGVGFVALSGQDEAMLHALHIDPAQRRQGLARHMMTAAANWAAEAGAQRLSLVVTQGNSAARGLYASLGMEIVGAYHYRIA